MTKILGKLTVVLFAAMCSSFIALGEMSDANKLVGEWHSEPVRLVRGDMEEIYFFSVRLSGAARDADTDVLDIEYFSTHAPELKRLIRQHVSLKVDKLKGRTIFVGANPRLVSGPEIVGVYEPDSLYCNTASRDSPDNLSCTWGSPAHGNAPVVKLFRQ